MLEIALKRAGGALLVRKELCVTTRGDAECLVKGRGVMRTMLTQAYCFSENKLTQLKHFIFYNFVEISRLQKLNKSIIFDTHYHCQLCDSAKTTAEHNFYNFLP